MSDESLPTRPWGFLLKMEYELALKLMPPPSGPLPRTAGRGKIESSGAVRPPKAAPQSPFLFLFLPPHPQGEGGKAVRGEARIPPGRVWSYPWRPLNGIVMRLKCTEVHTTSAFRISFYPQL